MSSAVKEVCFDAGEAERRFALLAGKFNWQYKTVKDEIGLVTMRILAMIINEAAKTLEEGTATKEDIDRGMELGTGYPRGPLKWCDKVG